MSRIRNRSAIADPSGGSRNPKRSLFNLAAFELGWDGFKAEPPSREALKQADRVLRILNDTGFQPDRINASAEGGVTFAFLAGNRYADIACLNSGEILAVMSDRTGEPQVWEVAAAESSVRTTLERLRADVRL